MSAKYDNKRAFEDSGTSDTSPSKSKKSLLSRVSDDGMYIGLDGEPREMTEFEKIARAAGVSANMNRLNKDALVEQLIGRNVPGVWSVEMPKKAMTAALRDFLTEQGVTGVKNMPVSSAIKKGDSEWILTMEQEERWKEICKFVEEHNMGKLNRKKKRFLLECSREQVDTFKLGIIIAESCKQMDLRGAFQSYREYKAMGVFPSFDDACNLLSLVAGLGEQGSSAGPLRVTEPPQDVEACSTVFRDLKEREVQLNENNYTAVIRCLSMNDRSGEALELYREMKSHGIPPKLRTFTHLLAAHSHRGDKEVCFELYKDITEKNNLYPSEKDYVSMLKVCELCRDMQFYSILSSMMEDILVPRNKDSTWGILRKWFSEVEHGFVVTESALSIETGILSCHGQKLRSIDLDVTTRKILLSQVNALASQREESVLSASAAQNGSDGDIVLGGGKGKLSKERLLNMQKHKYKAEERWQQFTAWVEGVVRETVDDPNAAHKNNMARSHGGEVPSSDLVRRAMLGEEVFSASALYKYDVIIDGANVGYYKTNYDGAPTHVDFTQLDWAVQQLKQDGHRPLVMLHCRHVDPRRMPVEAEEFVTAWKKEGLLYETPHGCNDDWFWLYLAVILRAKVLTNDEMRDHTFQMLSPRWFDRWRERNQIHFSFGTWQPRHFETDEDKSVAGSTVTDKSNKDKNYRNRMWRKCLFQKPRMYSYRMQSLQDGKSYAFPAEGDEKWLCAFMPESGG